MPEFRLLQPHSINKVLHPIGTVVTLPQQLGDGLKDAGIAEPLEAPAPTIPRAVDLPRNPVRMLTQPTPKRFKCCGQRP